MTMPLLGGVTRFHAYGPRQLERIAERYGLSPSVCETIRLFSLVLPFRVNEYVLSELIDWQRVPDDPIYQLVFPQSGMLDAEDERRLAVAAREPDSSASLDRLVQEIRSRLNPHPAGQVQLNVPSLRGAALAGMQHKYRETVLYFPEQGQTCHAYCTYCFRWAQFVGDASLRFAARGPDQLIAYLEKHPEVTDVLVTGGDPMVMSGKRLRLHLEPLLRVETLRNIRIGTKSVAYWPHRFVTDPDAEDTLRLFAQVVDSGRNLAVMAHFSHARELGTKPAELALARIRATGATIYCQAPLIAHVNDDAGAWAQLWRAQVAAGAVPYYLFVARDTGPRDYFKVPLARALQIFQDAYRQVSGLARTVRGPVMSVSAGKVVLDGIERAPAGRFFQLRFIQARDPDWVGHPFRARYSSEASWFDELELDPPLPFEIGSVARARR